MIKQEILKQYSEQFLNYVQADKELQTEGFAPRTLMDFKDYINSLSYQAKDRRLSDLANDTKLITELYLEVLLLK